MNHYIAISRRLRQTPFTAGVEAAGVKAYTVYNRMLLPAVFDTMEEDYRHLKTHVQVWDVAVERQVELNGPDATRLMQMLTPRDLSRIKADQCFYVPITDENGGMLNDPVALQLSDTRWWISIADSDLLFWIKGLAQGAGLDVAVFEPDVSPLAVQGPKAETLMARLFGEEVRKIGFFRYRRMAFGDTSFIVARSGYSRQGGFEIYVEDGLYGMPLWDALFEAGADLDVRAGCPNLIERIEGGLLSYGNDMTLENTPLECGLGKFMGKNADHGFVGRTALETEKTNGITRQIRPISVSGAALAPARAPWPLFAGEQPVGQITSAVWSPDFETNVAIGMVDAGHWDAGTQLHVKTPDGLRAATIQAQFWL
jgi:dimethylsulfoniopropionate demethylase